MSTPVRFGDWWYVVSTTEGQNYPVHHRGRSADTATEHVLLDENVEATGHDYFDLGAFELSMNHRFAAWSMDTKGDERYTLTLFAVTVLLSLLMVSTVRFRSLKDLKLNTGTVLFVLFLIGSSVFVWQRYKAQFVLVWLLCFYVLIGLVEFLRDLAMRPNKGKARTSLPPPGDPH